MAAELGNHRLKDPNYALQWWNQVEKSTIGEVEKRKLLYATFFVDVARGYLSI